MYDEEVKIIEPDTVTCELMLETAKSCRFLLNAETRIMLEVSNAETRERYFRNVNRLEFFFRTVPSILDPRRVICLCDRAAENPDWWRCNRIHFFCGELTYSKIAELLNLKSHQVRDYCKHVHIDRACYDNLPNIKR